MRIPASRHRLLILLALLAVSGWVRVAHAQQLSSSQEKRLTSWFRSATRSAPGEWGIAIANQQGQILWSIHPDRPMIPASTVKVLTTGFARTILGSDARRATRVVGAGHVDQGSGEWVGRWSLELNGDPSLESPYVNGPRLDDLALQLAAIGVKKLSGPLQVTSSEGTAEAVFPEAWSRSNWGSIYAPLVGPLTVHENMIWVHVRAGSKVGARAKLVETSPKGIEALVTVHATTTSGRRSRLAIRRMADGGYLVTGRIGTRSGTRRLIATATDTKAVLAAAWARALSSAGIEWDRTPAVLPAENSSTQILAEVNSPPLDSLALDINRRSLNIGAELLLHWAGGRDRGAELLTEHVQQVAGVSGGVHLADGSGMSREDRITPATFVYYLAKFPTTPAGKNFPQLLPANGTGTLARLATGLPGAGVVHAKTGTLNGVSTLVGYLGRKDGVLLVSLLYNGPRSGSARRSQWQLFRLLGADGVIIPPDSFDPASDQEAEQARLGGEESP